MAHWSWHVAVDGRHLDMGKSRVLAAPSCEKWVARDSQQIVGAGGASRGVGGGKNGGQVQTEPAKSG